MRRLNRWRERISSVSPRGWLIGALLLINGFLPVYFLVLPLKPVVPPDLRELPSPGEWPGFRGVDPDRSPAGGGDTVPGPPGGWARGSLWGGRVPGRSETAPGGGPGDTSPGSGARSTMGAWELVGWGRSGDREIVVLRGQNGTSHAVPEGKRIPGTRVRVSGIDPRSVRLTHPRHPSRVLSRSPDRDPVRGIRESGHELP